MPATATRTKDTNLDSLKTSKSTARGTCPRCGKRSTKGFIQINVSKYGTEKSAHGAKHIKSKGRSMCATCIKEVFAKLNQIFDEEVDHG